MMFGGSGISPVCIWERGGTGFGKQNIKSSLPQYLLWSLVLWRGLVAWNLTASMQTKTGLGLKTWARVLQPRGSVMRLCSWTILRLKELLGNSAVLKAKPLCSGVKGAAGLSGPTFSPGVSQHRVCHYHNGPLQHVSKDKDVELLQALVHRLLRAFNTWERATRNVISPWLLAYLIISFKTD